MGVVTNSPPQIMAQVGKLHLPILLDSGSARSLISFDHFQQLSRGDPTLQLGSTGVMCNGVRAEFGNCWSSKCEA